MDYQILGKALQSVLGKVLQSVLGKALQSVGNNNELNNNKRNNNKQDIPHSGWRPHVWQTIPDK